MRCVVLSQNILEIYYDNMKTFDEFINEFKVLDSGIKQEVIKQLKKFLRSKSNIDTISDRITSAIMKAKENNINNGVLKNLTVVSTDDENITFSFTLKKDNIKISTVKIKDFFEKGINKTPINKKYKEMHNFLYK